MKTLILMKVKCMALSLAISTFVFTGICGGQESEAQKRFEEDFAKSEQQAVAAYPDATKIDSALTKRIIELDNVLKENGDPLYYSADKPMILATRAAAELGIAAANERETKFNEDLEKSANQAVAPHPDATSADSDLIKKIIELDRAVEVAGDHEFIKEPGWDHYRSKVYKFEDELIPEFFSYKSVRVRKVEPDGLKIIHESGAAKIGIESLSAEQRLKYGLNMENAAEYRSLVADRATAYRLLRLEEARKAKIKAQDDEMAGIAAEQYRLEQIRANPPRVTQPPVWKRFVDNEEFRSSNREDIAGEIRQQDGDAAADRFLMEQRSKDAEYARMVPSQTPSTRYLEGGKLMRQGDRINAPGNPSRGYKVEGDKLYSLQDGSPTHTRSGGMWVPLNSSHTQIWDP